MIGMALMAVLMCVNFASCSKDDDDFSSGGGSNIPKNTIRYQTTDGTRIRFKDEDIFGGARIVKHTYSTDDWWVLEFSSDVIAIDDNAFYDNHTLLSIILPNSVTSIGWHAFYGCSGLTSITIPNSVTSIGNEAFPFCDGLTSVTIGNSVTSIGYGAFAHCDSLTSITIPNSVTSIGNYAFNGCSGLTSVTIPNSVTSIGEDAFYGTAWYNNQPDGVVYAGKVLYGYKGQMPEGTSINIKDGTLGIAGDAFLGCSSLTSITIPNSVTSIGECAFGGCSGLTSIVVENGNPEYDSRENCNAIIETATATNILITGCKNTIIPNSVTSIGYYAFYGCSGLTSITIPNSVTSIGYKAFYGCDSLTSITIPNSVRYIGEWAFHGCSALTSITIPNSVTSIGYEAFYGCDSLTSIYVKWSTPIEFDSYFDYDVRENATLYVPKGSLEAYKAAYGWEDFKNIQEWDAK